MEYERKYGLGPIEFKGTRKKIPTYYTDHKNQIPAKYMIHGTVYVDNHRNINIVDFYQEFYIVKYDSDVGKETQLAFKEHSLIPTVGTIFSNESIDNFSII